MAHEIDTMAFVGATPWHSLGHPVPAGVGTEGMINAAGTGWMVEKHALLTHTGRSIETHCATVRTDTGAVLGVVGSDYGIVQNRDVFGFLDTLAPEGVEWETAGSLAGGRKVWALARIPGIGRVEHSDGRIDDHRRYMLATTAHDGSGALQVTPTLVRVVCMNTLSVSLREAKAGLRVKHTRRVIENADAAIGTLKASIGATATLADAARALAVRPFTRADMGAFAESLADRVIGKLAAAPTQRAVTMRTDRIEALVNLFEHGVGNAGRDRYDALSAVTEWADHHAPTRGDTERIDSATFGALAAWKHEAMAMLTV